MHKQRGTFHQDSYGIIVINYICGSLILMYETEGVLMTHKPITSFRCMLDSNLDDPVIIHSILFWDFLYFTLYFCSLLLGFLHQLDFYCFIEFIPSTWL